MTVTVPQDSNKLKVQSHQEAPRSKPARRGGRGRGNRKSQNEGVPPHNHCRLGDNYASLWRG